MPRGRGGKRQGTPGVTYSNRSDLNSNKYLPEGQAYGARQNAEQFRDSGPMPTASPLPTGPGGGPTPQGPPPAPIDIFAPTDRPNEPVTAGIPLGAGPGGQPLLPEDPDEIARWAYSVSPHPHLAEILLQRDA